MAKSTHLFQVHDTGTRESGVNITPPMHAATAPSTTLPA